jgi:hypothetical protein
MINYLMAPTMDAGMAQFTAQQEAKARAAGFPNATAATAWEAQQQRARQAAAQGAANAPAQSGESNGIMDFIHRKLAGVDTSDGSFLGTVKHGLDWHPAMIFHRVAAALDGVNGGGDQ